MLDDCGLIARLYPELIAEPSRWKHARQTLDAAAGAATPWPARFALLASAAADGFERWITRLRVDADASDLARLWIQFRDDLNQSDVAPAAALALLERTDALRRPERFELLLGICALLDGVDVMPWRRARAAAAAVDAGAVAAAAGGNGAVIAAALKHARAAAIAQQMSRSGYETRRD